MNTVRDFLAQGKPLLFDGAMGTCYAALPGRAELPCERAVLDHPEEIAAIHRAYLEAGCRAVKTNTFALGTMLAQGEESQARALLEAACALAGEAALPWGAFVFGDMGPVPNDGAVTAGELYCRQADWFLEQGVSCFLVETLASDAGVEELGRYLKKKDPASFLAVSFAVGADGLTREGLPGRELLRAAAALREVDAVGVNCMSGPHHLLQFVRGLGPLEKPLSVMPNAGYPTVLGRRAVYQGTPEYFSRQMLQIVRAGAAIVGGCCGTSPAHIAALAAALSKGTPSVKVSVPAAPSTPAAPAGENPLWEKLAAGKRVLAVELDPPADGDVAPYLDGVRALKAAGVDAITIADSPVGRPRADSSLLSCKLKRELGVEPLPHMACRDRNLIATKALLLGLSMEGVHNVLAVTGDPIPTADRDEVKSVFNFNSRKLARYITALNGTVFQTPFRIYGALNVNAKNFAVQLELAREKEKNGVSAFLTQPILSQRALDNLRLARETLGSKLLAGVFPVVSHRNAVFLNNEVSGVYVCDEILRLYEGKDRAEGEALGERVSLEAIRAAAPWSDGVYLMTPFRRVELMGRIIAAMEREGLSGPSPDGAGRPGRS